MKKALSISLSLLFIVAAVGVPLSTHYCSGQLITSQLVHPFTEKPCECPPDKDMGDCCHDKLQYEQVESEFLQSTSSPVFAQQLTETIWSPFSSFINLKQTAQKAFVTHFRDKSPPRIPSGRSVSILYQSFLL